MLKRFTGMLGDAIAFLFHGRDYTLFLLNVSLLIERNGCGPVDGKFYVVGESIIHGEGRAEYERWFGRYRVVFCPAKWGSPAHADLRQLKWM